MFALLALCCLLPGCEAAGALAAVEVASIPVFGRALSDIAVSAATGRDCSLVRLDRGETYCAPRPGPAPALPVCTRSLGVVDCWRDPDALPAPIHPVGDGPALPGQGRPQPASSRP